MNFKEGVIKLSILQDVLIEWNITQYLAKYKVIDIKKI